MPERTIAPIGDKQIIIETGKTAKQADGAVTVQLGETIVIVAAVGAAKAKPGQEFFPLTVDYREKAAAAGKFPSKASLITIAWAAGRAAASSRTLKSVTRWRVAIRVFIRIQFSVTRPITPPPPSEKRDSA